ncbi:MAG: COX15/CtaA family protein, partial [Burkholderiaceae bacterium]|nr:COX15/CtaA family protein [Burkholderiaceae bacterium]
VLALGLAVLGRWSSDARVPAVAIGNLLGGFAMLALCWRLTHDTGATLAPGWRAWARVAALLVALQVALGGLVSASFSATSCSGFSDCIDAARGLPWTALDPWREPVLAGAPPINASGALAQAMHRVLGVLLLFATAPLALAALRSARPLATAVLLTALTLVVGLGLVMAGSGPALGVALAHNLGAALLLATLVELSRSPRPTPHPSAPS